MWMGMKRLNLLDLGNNQFSHIGNKSPSKLHPFGSLYLYKNNLTTLSRDIFHQSRGSHPQNLLLDIKVNPLHCDSKLFWLKSAEEEGWITTKGMDPDCANYPGKHWKEIDFGCEDTESNGGTEIHGSGGGSGKSQGYGD